MRPKVASNPKKDETHHVVYDSERQSQNQKSSRTKLSDLWRRGVSIATLSSKVKIKMGWPSHISLITADRWSKSVLEWRPMNGTRSIGCLKARWTVKHNNRKNLSCGKCCTITIKFQILFCELYLYS